MPMLRMRFIFSLIVIFSLVGGYLYMVGAGLCPAPLEYRVGILDERFALTEEEAIASIASAAAIWEEATERDLFVYSDDADFTINFIFDERQATADAESNFRDRLDTAEAANDSIENQYDLLLSEYNTLQAEYESASAQYEANLASYNDLVSSYNTQGGAPPGVYADLQAQQRSLDREREGLNQYVSQLNTLVEKINKLSSRGTQLIETYNRGVEVYNNTFGESREFTQGDYRGSEINIYTFVDEAELQLVLAHELGHALHLGHVENSESVLYYLIGDQPVELSLTEHDLDEFDRVCTPRTVRDTIYQGYLELFNQPY